MYAIDSSTAARRQAARLIRAREDERARIARDLHDVLGSTLAALKFDLHLASRQLERKLGRTADVELARVLAHARSMDALVNEAIESCRELVRDHHPRALQEKGLVGAIEDWAFRFARQAGLRCMISSAENLPALPEAMSLALYRVVQEALHNVARHARAASISIRIRAARGQLTLEIQDDGIGIAPNAADSAGGPAGYGLTSMRERIHAHEGEVRIAAGPEGGTRIVCRVPLVQAFGAALSA